MDEKRLAEVFIVLAGGAEMDGWSFARCIKSAGLVKGAHRQSSGSGSYLSATDIDLIFAKLKSPGSRKIKFPDFLAALRSIAARIGLPSHVVAHMVSLVATPTTALHESSTASGPTRLFYDQSTYTGTHKHGGPKIVISGSGDGYIDLRMLVDRDHVQDDALHRRRYARHQCAAVPLSPSVARAERLFYDKSTYTGTHKQGGPTVVGSGLLKEGYSDLSELVDRDHVQDDALHRRRKADGRSNNKLEPSSDDMTANVGPESLFYERSMYTCTSKCDKADVVMVGGHVDFGKWVDRDRSSSNVRRWNSSPARAERSSSPTRPTERPREEPICAKLSPLGSPCSTERPREEPVAVKTSPPGSPERTFHDKSAYIGVHGQGGLASSGPCVDLSELVKPLPRLLGRNCNSAVEQEVKVANTASTDTAQIGHKSYVTPLPNPRRIVIHIKK